jgi:hypothetical protein
MIDKTPPTPPHDPLAHVGHQPGPHIKVPESYQKAGFTEDDYKKYMNQMVQGITQDMNKVTNKAIQALKEQRQKIESGEA